MDACDDDRADLLIGGGVAANGRLRRCSPNVLAASSPCVRRGPTSAPQWHDRRLGAEIVASGGKPSALDIGADSSMPVSRSWCELLRHIPTHVSRLWMARSVCTGEFAPVSSCDANVSLRPAQSGRIVGSCRVDLVRIDTHSELAVRRPVASSRGLVECREAGCPG